MDVFLVALLLIVGFGLILVEFLLLPGTTVIGFAGAALMAAGIYFGYKNFGTSSGHIILISSVVSVTLLIYIGVKLKVWRLFALEDSVTGHAEEEDIRNISVGMTGKAKSDLRPEGRGEFEDEWHDVISTGPFIDSGSGIKIVKITEKKIFVEELDS